MPSPKKTEAHQEDDDLFGDEPLGDELDGPTDRSDDSGSDDSGDGSDSGQAPDDEGRLRDIVFRELAKRDEKIDRLSSEFSAGFGELKGMLQGQQPQGGQGATSEDSEGEELRELSDEEIQRYVEAGRGAEVYRYLARAEAMKVAKEEDRRLRQSLREEQALETGTASLYDEFPELNEATHPFTIATNKLYNQLASRYGGHERVKGTPLQMELAGRAAEKAARVHAELRDDFVKDKRRRQNASDTAHATNGSLTPGRGKPKGADGSGLPQLTREDAVLAERWGVNLSDKKAAEKIRGFKQHYAGRRYEKRSEEDFGKV